MLLFKIIGFTLIIAVCTATGFAKAASLKLRAQKLYNLQKGVTQLKELIRLGGGEMDTLATQCFNPFPIDYSQLKSEDCKATENLFDEIAMLDSEAAYNRCDICISLLKMRHAEAETNYRELGKLYKSVGALCGVFICIFFI